MSRLSGTSKRTVAIVAGAILIVLAVGVGIAVGIGDESVDSDSVAVVDGTQIPKADFDAAIEQAATRQGLQEVPAADDEAFEALRDEALNQVLDVAWIEGEAEKRGVSVSDREVEEEFQTTKDENFETEKEYEDFLKQSGFTQEDIDERVRLQLISEKIQTKVEEDAPTATDEDVEQFYEENKASLEQPAGRDIRLVLAKDQKDADKAAEELGEDNSPERWNEIAAKFSTDEATKGAGGVRAGVTEGVFPDPLNSEVFSASEGEVLGPIETPDGFYVFQVDAINEGGVQSLDEARPAIEDQLNGTEAEPGLLKQEAFTAFVAGYRDYWTKLTICADDYLIERCDNDDGEITPCPDPTLSDEEQKQLLDQQGCPPPVVSMTPAAPGSVLRFGSAPGQPQKPHPAGTGEAPPATGAPGAIPGGAVPGGAAPPGGAQAPPPQAQP